MPELNPHEERPHKERCDVPSKALPLVSDEPLGLENLAPSTLAPSTRAPPTNAPGTRAIGLETRRVMQTSLYRSWNTYISSATQLNGEPFSERTVAHLKSNGTGFLVYMFSQPPPDEAEVNNDEHLRRNLRALTAAQVSAYISSEGRGKKVVEAQLRSVLRTLVRPWLLSEGISPNEALPTPETSHPADAIFSSLSFSKPLAAYLSDCQTAHTLSKEAAANTTRISQRFVRFIYDLLLRADHASPGPEISLPATMNAESLDAAIKARFDELVRLFGSTSGPNAPQASQSAAASVRSALNRHLRPVVLGKVPPLPAVRNQHPRSAPAEASGSADVYANLKAPADNDALVTAIAGAQEPQLKPEPVPSAKVPPINVSEAEYNVILERALAVVAGICKRPRADVAQLGINDIRIDRSAVRIFPPSLGDRIPTQWLISNDKELRAALEGYLAAKRSLSTRPLLNVYFHSYRGESLAPPEVKKPQGKSGRR